MNQPSSIAEERDDWPILVFCGAWIGSGCLIVLTILVASLYCEWSIVATNPDGVGPAERPEIVCDPFDGDDIMEAARSPGYRAIPVRSNH